MRCFMYVDGKKRKMDEDIFDQMGEALHQPQSQTPQSSVPQEGNLIEDGTHDKTPLNC